MISQKQQEYISREKEKFVQGKLKKILEENFLQLLSVYENASSIITVKCDACSFIFETRYLSIYTKPYAGTPCPQCRGRTVYPIHVIEESIKHKWKIISSLKNIYLASRQIVKAECIHCQYVWKTELRNVFKKHSHCPSCKWIEPETLDKLKTKGSIYKITNKLNGHVYIGQTIQKFYKRYSSHIRASKDKTHPAYYTSICSAIRKHGEHNFQWEVIHRDVPWDQLDDFEVSEIKKHDSYHSGYNETSGGNIGSRNVDLAKQRYEKYLKKEREKEIEQRALNQKRFLTNFEKNLKKDLQDFIKKDDRGKENEFKKLQESVKRSVSGKKKYQNKDPDSSKYIGVCWEKKLKKWKASIKHRGKKIHIGVYNDEKDAALAYDTKCIQLRGNKAKTNF